ncbi:uncharacterized protein N7515_009678 [Penicillium bovifimosum]|uniref:Uncharacterized protein n=1 Tax=Penicillium bovifimosum TaxID=126998 RepID=A0A9W9KUV3_9EURO|nr:uncharacterized protein N7515_009678 [Penicillium bovifimosum]KAJ5120290.1 hypothetical protein N7515_009678 [Penicillium bovifimosum]
MRTSAGITSATTMPKLPAGLTAIRPWLIELEAGGAFALTMHVNPEPSIAHVNVPGVDDLTTIDAASVPVYAEWEVSDDVPNHSCSGSSHSILFHAPIMKSLLARLPDKTLPNMSEYGAEHIADRTSLISLVNS